MDKTGRALVQFSIGPVQGFIESARTTRDLWTGSYTISWLTAHACAEAIKLGADVRATSLRVSPLVQFHGGMCRDATDEHLLACLPNKFVAETSSQQAQELAAGIEAAVRREWRALCDAVHGMLDGKFARLLRTGGRWDAGWIEQLENYWDIRMTMLPALENARVDELVVHHRALEDSKASAADPMRQRRALLGALAEAGKHIAHYPPHAPVTDRRKKCALTGADSRMGPLDGRANDEFWGQGEDACEPNAVSVSQHDGTRLQSRDRYGAVALVKRYAWVCHFSKKLGLNACRLKTRDTATIAAEGWLTPELRKLVEAASEWSGQWLHAGSRDAGIKEGDQPCPVELWQSIKSARNEAGPPPAYYAVLMLDGDNMGTTFRGLSSEQADALSAALQQFALDVVPPIIRAAGGQLVYAGGDDVLAMLPLRYGDRNALDVAADLNAKFKDAMQDVPGGSAAASTSAGLVVAHYKENLRDVLEAARHAEKVAKAAGRNQMCLSIVRRGAEEEASLLPWESAVPTVSGLIGAFADKELSDRWTYQLRQEWETLSKIETGPTDVIDQEVARLLSRSTKQETFEVGWSAWEKLKGKCVTCRRNALAAIQAASFIARGRDK